MRDALAHCRRTRTDLHTFLKNDRVSVFSTCHSMIPKQRNEAQPFLQIGTLDALRTGYL